MLPMRTVRLRRALPQPFFPPLRRPSPFAARARAREDARETRDLGGAFLAPLAEGRPMIHREFAASLPPPDRALLAPSPFLAGGR